jgi:hypothetical protein
VVGAEEADGAAAAEIRRHAPPPTPIHTVFEIFFKNILFFRKLELSVVLLKKNIYIDLVVPLIMCFIKPIFGICATLL